MTPSNWIDHLAPADGAPPKTLLNFFSWALKGSFPILILSGMTSILTGVIEVSAVLMLGMLVDAAIASSPQNPLGNQIWLFAVGVGFFLILRPIIFGAFSYMQTIVVTPNIFNLVLSRLHRWTLGQPIQFFDNDFAGRIAQKEMQTARAVTDVVVEVLHTVLFALASVIGAALMLTSVNITLAIGLCVWLVGYLFMIRYFMPLIRKRSGARASARAMVTGQIVDTVTNIKTVKLFAHDDHEDREVRRAAAGGAVVCCSCWCAVWGAGGRARPPMCATSGPRGGGVLLVEGRGDVGARARGAALSLSPALSRGGAVGWGACGYGPKKGASASWQKHRNI